MRLFHTIMFVGAITALSLMVVPAAAQIDSVDCGDLGIGIKCTKTDKTDAVITYVKNILNVFLTLLAIIAIIIVIYAGVQYITAAGDQNKASTAKATIMYALIGLLVVGFAMVLVNFVIEAINGAGPS